MTASLVHGDHVSCSRVGGGMRREASRLRQHALSLEDAIGELVVWKGPGPMPPDPPSSPRGRRYERPPTCWTRRGKPCSITRQTSPRVTSSDDEPSCASTAPD